MPGETDVRLASAAPSVAFAAVRKGRLAGMLVMGLMSAGAVNAAATPVSVTPLPGSPYYTQPPKDRAARGTNGSPSAVEIAQLSGGGLDAASLGNGLRTLIAPADPLTSPFAKTSLQTSAVGQLFLVDTDDDGDRDIVQVNSVLVKPWRGDGTGAFEEQDDAGLPDNTSSVVAEFNGDAYPDIVLVTAAGRELVPGSSSGDYIDDPVTIEGAGNPAPTVQAAGDTDGDGDQDVIGAGPGFVRILRNDGGGAFTPLDATGVAGTPAALTAADLDEDGKADPVVLMEDGRIVVVRSSGGVTDTPSGLAAAPGNAGAVRAADLDGDAHLDVVAGNASGGLTALRVLTGSGSGDFTCGSQGLPSPTFGALGGIAVGDLSGDGLADIAVSSANGSQVDLLRNTTAVTTTDAEISLPNEAKWVSEAPFVATLNGQATDVEWDFGEGRTWTEGDLADPECRTFEPDPGGAVHAYGAVYAPKSIFEPKNDTPFDPLVIEGVAPGVDGSVPPIAPTEPPGQAEVRKTYLVRARFTTPSGAKAIVARTVVVRPDTAPKPVISLSDPLDYSGTTIFRDGSVEPDGDAGRDQIIRAQWNFLDGSPVVEQGPGNLSHNFFLARLNGRAPLNQLVPTGTGAQKAAAVEAAAAALQDVAGPAYWKGDQGVALTVTDRSGRTGSKLFTFPRAPRTVPRPALSVPGATGAKGKQKLTDPIVAGTPVDLDLRPSKLGRNARLAFHVLRAGLPKNPPCAAGQKCKKKVEPALRTQVGEPVVVSEKELFAGGGKAAYTFPTVSPEGEPYSVLDTVYDETGAVGRTRYDGFKVVKGSGACTKVRGREFGESGLVLSGTCVDVSDGAQLYASAQPVTINGLKIRPPEGNVIVVAACKGGSARILVRPAAPPAGANCGRYLLRLTRSVGPLAVLAGDEAIATIPADDQGKLTQKANNNRFRAFPAADRYQGFPVEGKTATLVFSSGGSGKPAIGRLLFTVKFPDALSASPSTTNTGATKVSGRDLPDEVVVTEFDGFTAKVPKARAAQAKAPEPQIKPPNTLMLGPIDLSSIAGDAFKYDAGTDTFSATAKDIPLPLPGGSATIRVILKDGELLRADGDVGGLTIPITPAINLTGFGFTIEQQAQGLLLQGRANFGDVSGLILTGQGRVTSLLSSDFSLTIDGTGTIVQLLPVHASLGYSGGGVKFGAGTGASYGPVSFSADLRGAFAGDGFQIDGEGRACLFACLKINGLASERGIAGCGSVDLVFTTLVAGFGYLFKGPVNTFVGSCNLSPYASNIATRRAGEEGTFSVPPRVVSDAISIRVGAAGPLRPGATPQVQVRDSNGVLVAQTTSELGATSTTGNLTDGTDYHVFVEQDASDGVVRFLVPKPPGGFTGDYKVERLDGSSIAIAKPDVAYTDPPVEKAVAAAALTELTPDQIADVKAKRLPILGSHPSDVGNTGPKLALLNGQAPATVEPADLTADELSRLRFLAVVGTLPPGQTITFRENGDTTERELATVKADAKGEFAFTGVFAPSSFTLSGQRCIKGFVETEEGIPRGAVPRVACFVTKPLSFKQPQLTIDLKRFGPKKVKVDVKGLDVTGWRQAAVLQIRKGPVSRSVALSANLIADLQTKKPGFRASAVDKPVAKRSFEFPITGLPKGKAPIRMLVAGVDEPGEPGKVSVLKGVLKKGQGGLRLNTNGKGKVKHLKAKKKKAKKCKGARRARRARNARRPVGRRARRSAAS